MSTTTAKGAGTTNNDGGVVLGIGSQDKASDSVMSSGIGLSEVNTSTDYGSKVVTNDGGSTPGFTDPMGVTKAKSGGTGGLAYFPTKDERNFLVKGAGDTAAGKINNDASTVFTIPGADFGHSSRDNIHEVVSTRRIGADASESFDVLAVPSSGVVPGRTKGANAGDAQAFQSASGVGVDAVDNAATPTRAVPGKLTYHFGGLGKATTDEYKARDAFDDATDTSS